jgi:hypothetical protein
VQLFTSGNHFFIHLLFTLARPLRRVRRPLSILTRFQRAAKLEKPLMNTRIVQKLGISLICAASVMGAAFRASAVPTMQLDIAGGTYDPVSQTIIASGNPFTLYALLDPKNADPNAQYFISAAIIPQTAVAHFGSFTVNGTTYSGTLGNMQYGTPPVSAAFPDLPSHGIFPTYYAEIPFTFNSANKATSYDTSLHPGGFQASATGSLLYQSFTIDISNVPAGYVVHFDFYDEWLKTHPTLATETDFAPFSHDAQCQVSTGGGSHDTLPDGGSTVTLLGFGLLGIGALRQRLGRK